MFEYMEYNLKRVFNVVGLKEGEFTISGDDEELDINMDLKRFSKKFEDTRLCDDVRAIVIAFVSDGNYFKLTHESMNYGTYKNEMTFRHLGVLNYESKEWLQILSDFEDGKINKWEKYIRLGKLELGENAKYLDDDEIMCMYCDNLYTCDNMWEECGQETLEECKKNKLLDELERGDC